MRNFPIAADLGARDDQVSAGAGLPRRLPIDMNGHDHYSDHMGRTVTATEAKAKILALLDEVEAGEEIEITRHGRLVARLVPARPGLALMGRFRGEVEQLVSDEELMTPIDEAEFDGWDWIADPEQEQERR